MPRRKQLQNDERMPPQAPPDHGEHRGWRYSLKSVISGERVYSVTLPSGTTITSRVKHVRDLLDIIDRTVKEPSL